MGATMWPKHCHITTNVLRPFQENWYTYFRLKSLAILYILYSGVVLENFSDDQNFLEHLHNIIKVPVSVLLLENVEMNKRGSMSFNALLYKKFLFKNTENMGKSRDKKSRIRLKF